MAAAVWAQGGWWRPGGGSLERRRPRSPRRPLAGICAGRDVPSRARPWRALVGPSRTERHFSSALAAIQSQRSGSGTRPDLPGPHCQTPPRTAPETTLKLPHPCTGRGDGGPMASESLRDQPPGETQVPAVAAPPCGAPGALRGGGRLQRAGRASDARDAGGTARTRRQAGSYFFLLLRVFLPSAPSAPSAAVASPLAAATVAASCVPSRSPSRSLMRAALPERSRR